MWRLSLDPHCSFFHLTAMNPTNLELFTEGSAAEWQENFKDKYAWANRTAKTPNEQNLRRIQSAMERYRNSEPMVFKTRTEMLPR